jgi:aspartate carbamoyltransferase catalytic subunit
METFSQPSSQNPLPPINHILESQQFSKETLFNLFQKADQLRLNPTNSLNNKILAALFYEPSTRTRLSFESAMLKLGGKVIGTENAKEFSSAIKGESLEDSIRIISKYADIIVMRHHETGAAKQAAEVSQVPIINAGDGKGQHPTQALLDLYTIHREFQTLTNVKNPRLKSEKCLRFLNTFEIHPRILNPRDSQESRGLKIAMVGDLASGRTVRSLCYLLGKFENLEIIFVSPENLKMNQDIKDYLTKHNIRFREETNLNQILPEIDIVYMTRIQKERISLEDYEKAKGKYIINQTNLHLIKPTARILHPLPHVEEIDIPIQTENQDPRIAYFRQAENGLYIRMALLDTILNN